MTNEKLGITIYKCSACGERWKYPDWGYCLPEATHDGLACPGTCVQAGKLEDLRVDVAGARRIEWHSPRGLRIRQRDSAHKQRGAGPG